MPSSRRLLTLLALTGLLACAESPLEPVGPQPLPPLTPRLMLPPGTTPASFGLVIDTVQLTVRLIDTTCWQCDISHADTLLLDTLITWPADQETLEFRYEVLPPPPAWVVYLDLTYRGAGVGLFAGSAMVDFRRGNIRVPEIPLYYYGPGYNSDDIQVAPGDTALAVGDTLQFTATAYANAFPLDTAYISWRVTDSTAASIDHTGRLILRSGALGHSFLVVTAVPNGAITTTRVSVPTTVTSLLEVSGDSQSAALGERTAAPLVIRARAADNRPVAGARIRFRYLSGAGATFADSIVFTDQLGLARSAPVPTTLGVTQVQAELTANTGVATGFTVTGTAAVARQLLFAGDSGGSGYQLYRADSTGGNRALIGYLSAGSIAFTAPAWNPARNKVAYTYYNANAATQQLIISTAIGDTLATFVSDSNSYAPRFSPTGKMIAWICHGVPNGLTSGGVCTYNGADAAVGSLSGAANGVARVEITATVPGRPDGPPAFAWKNDASTRIAFVRDTVLDSLAGVVASRIYQINGDGGTPLPITPRVTDLGRGPLRIEGNIDWSPDGSTIVFSAMDTTAYGLALYAADAQTGAVRRITTPPINWFGDLYPRFSPDGQRILFKRVSTYYCCAMVMDYFVVRTTGGSPTRITYDGSDWGSSNPDPYHLGGDWSPGGGSVVVVAPNGSGSRGAYKVPIDVTSRADYLARRVLVGTAGIGGLNDWQVSWRP